MDPTLRRDRSRHRRAHYLVDRLLVGLLTNGHVLLEGTWSSQDTQHPHPRFRHSGGLQANSVPPDLLPADILS